MFCSAICKGQEITKWRTYNSDTTKERTTYYQFLATQTQGGIDEYKTAAYVIHDTLIVKDSLALIKMLLMYQLNESQKHKSDWYKPLKFEDIKYPKNNNSQDSSYIESRSMFEKERGNIIFCKDCKSNEGKLGVKQVWDGNRWLNLE